jgi:cytochrome c peroxidase
MLGKQLFFDDTFLEPFAKRSCATCHQPGRGYTDGIPHFGRLATPTLLNTVYNSSYFWDGRASALEEVVQQRLEDERESAGRYHVWSGVIERLRKSGKYKSQFEKVFGTRATQDAVGKALATYMRTILSADSIHDRAEQNMRTRKASALEAGDYEKVLDKDAIKALARDPEKDKPADVAKDLLTGWTVFRKQAQCIQCHSGFIFTDNSFHNLGVGMDDREPFPGQETGRFAVLPQGLKNQRMIGAFRTPTLRGLPRTGPYFHDDSVNNLTDVVEFHIQGGKLNPYIAPELRDEKDRSKPRNLGLKETDTAALVLLLRALDGNAVDPVVAQPPK